MLERAGSARLLRELEERQLFTYELDDGSYRYHETLRSQLEATLVERLGESDTRDRFRRAGELLEVEGMLPDALHAYCRAEAWDEVERLLGRDGHQIVDGRPLWLDVIPPGILRMDAWLQLTVARQQRAVARFDAAIETYRGAEGLLQRVGCDRSLPPRADRTRDLGRAAPAARPRRARSAPHRDDARAAIRPSSGNTARDAGGPRRERARGAPRGALPRRSCSARTRARRARADRGFAAAAQLGLATAHLLAGDEGGAAEARLAAEQAERAGVTWLARLRTRRSRSPTPSAVVSPRPRRA